MSRFDEVAQYWDENPDRIAMAKAVSDAMELVVDFTDKDLLELGCGTGLVGLSLAMNARSLLGIDSSENMVNIFNQKVSTIGMKNVRAEQKDFLIEELSKVDVIFSSMVMHHIEDTLATLQRCYKLIKPGGHLLIADLDKEDGTFHSQGNEGIFHFGFDQDKLKNMLQACGFQFITFSVPHTIKRDTGKTYDIFLCTANKTEL